MPLQIDQGWVARVQQSLPELPDAKRQRFMTHYGLPGYDAEVLVTSRALADYYEATVLAYNQPKVVSNWVMGEVLRELNRHHQTPQDAPVTPASLAEMLQLIDDGVISGRLAKTVFEAMYRTGKPAAVVVQEQGLAQMHDSDALVAVIQQVLTAHPAQVADYRSGKHKLFGFFVGQIMKATQGKANPALVNELLQNLLG